MPNTKRLMTAAQVAAEADVSAETVRRWARSRKLRTVVLPSGQMRFDPDDVRQMLTPVETAAS